MNYAEYRAIDAANFSTLKAFALSPAHYRHRVQYQRADGEALRKGRAVHCAVFEPERFAAAWPTWDGTRRGAEWIAFLARCGGDYLLESEVDWVRDVAAAVHADHYAAPLLTGGQAEHVITWTDEATGVRCKARLDYLTAVALPDLKTCRDGSPAGFGRAAARLHYHAQLAFYVDGVRAVTGVFPVPYLIAVESEAPHVVQVYRVDDDAYACGQETYRGWLATLAECRKTNEWPGYREGVSWLLLPEWCFGDEGDIDGLGLDFGAEEAA